MNAIELESRYSAHNYAPLPVVLARGVLLGPWAPVPAVHRPILDH